ncbi:MAG: bifunctional phosphopantothenoylcysteine decarboxylase/phosphopantothenate--cysteine ligase CoaBC [Firmicutes bacterium]|nr:bifunctional phosphopantothenoylcysteine decarboxylase/phosphopantothenate--cysteine ligase CoaBC [Bacillota bacterium]
MKSKTIVLGVTGSIAAYKAAELASTLVKRGYSVHVIMTRAATKFITPLTFQTLSQNPVYHEMFEPPRDWEISHISLAQRADLVLVAPATANFICKLAAGLADDLLSATILATRAPVLIAPAMNEGMYENPVFQHHMKFLQSFGYSFVEPDTGRLACGVRGKGRLAEIQKIVEAVERILNPKRDLSGKRILVTAGPTREPLDPVRFLSNYSSGKMGYAIAEAARERGAEVILVSGPTDLEPPRGVELVPVETAQEMFDAVVARFPGVDVVIKAAAVSDFRPRAKAQTKIKKQEALVLELEQTPDILAYLGKHKRGDQILVGFAAETERILHNAEEKLKEKNLDLLVANDLTREGAGFGADTNIAILLYPGGAAVDLPKMTKKELAGVILDAVAKLLEPSPTG